MFITMFAELSCREEVCGCRQAASDILNVEVDASDVGFEVDTYDVVRVEGVEGGRRASDKRGTRFCSMSACSRIA